MQEDNSSKASTVKTCEIMRVHIAVTDRKGTLTLIEQTLSDWSGGYICVSNVHTTVTADEDEEYRKVQNGAVMALPDSGPLSKYCRDRGDPDSQRVTGLDLMKKMLSLSAEKDGGIIFKVLLRKPWICFARKWKSGIAVR